MFTTLQGASSLTAIPIVLICFFSTPGQNPGPRPTVLPTTAQVGYSESIPYVPRDLPEAGPRIKEKWDSQKQADAGSDPGMDRSSDRFVTVQVSVFDGASGFVGGLKAGDFKVFLQEKEVRVVSVDQNESPIDLVLMLDMSASTVSEINQIKLLANQVVEAVRPEDRIMVAGFSEKLTVSTDFTNDRNLISSAIQKLKKGNGTSIYDRLVEIIAKLRGNIPNRTAIIIFTDGVDTTSKSASYKTSLIEAEKSNITVYPVFFDTYEAVSKLPATLVVMVPGTLATADGLIVGPTIGRMPVPSNVPVPGMSKKEYDIGRYFLTDLLLLSGGRPITAKHVLANGTKEMSGIPQELRLQYRLTFKLPEDLKRGERYQLKVRVNAPKLTVLTKGSYIEN